MPSLSTRVAVSAAFHRSLQRASRLFGGRYGQHPPTLHAPETRTVSVGKVEIQTLTWAGSPPTIVVLHGLNNNAWSWARVASQLAPERQVVSVCQRGHGGSTAPAAGYSLQDTTNDVLGVLDAFSLDAVDMVGHSWGGKVATHFAATHPDRVGSLALADPALPKGLNGIIRTIPALTTASLRAERGPFPNRQAWETAGRSVNYLQRWDDLDQKLWADGFFEADDGSYHHVLPESGFQEILSNALTQDIEPLLTQIAGPVLLMRPTFTLSFLPGEVRSMRRKLPQMLERRIAGDHTFIHTNPLDTTDVLRSFLRMEPDRTKSHKTARSQPSPR